MAFSCAQTMPLRLAGISSKVWDTADKANRDEAANIPSPIRNSRRLMAGSVAHSDCFQLREMVSSSLPGTALPGLPPGLPKISLKYRPEEHTGTRGSFSWQIDPRRSRRVERRGGDASVMHTIALAGSSM